MKMMFARFGTIAAHLSVALALVVAAATTGRAQPAPSPASIEMAQEIVMLKGGDSIFSPLIPGVIEQGKIMFLQQNPALQKDLDDVAGTLRTEYAPRKTELMKEVA